MSIRLASAIIGSLLEEAALVAIVLWGLPQLGIRLPLWALIALMIAWGVLSFALYKVGSRALMRTPFIPSMLNSQGKVVSPLAPEGLVRIRGELWVAKSANGTIDIGEEVSVEEQDGLKLIVRRSRSAEGD